MHFWEAKSALLGSRGLTFEMQKVHFWEAGGCWEAVGAPLGKQLLISHGSISIANNIHAAS